MKKIDSHRNLMKSVLTASVFSLTAITSAVQAVIIDESTDPLMSAQIQNSQAASQRIIIKYNNTQAQVQGMAGTMAAEVMVNNLQASTATGLQHMRQLATGDQLFELQGNLSAAEVEDTIAQLAQNPDVESVYIDRLMRPMFTPNDSRYNEQWHYFETTGGLRLPAAWDVTNGSGAVVGVIDTGYLPHADLADNLLPGYDMISDASIAQDGNGRDSDARDEGDWTNSGECGPASSSSWHGTHVAGTVAAVTNNGIGVAGVAYGAKVVPIRALGRCGGYTSDIADSIIWGAGGNVPGIPTNPNPADVLNLSLGGGGNCDSTTQAAINQARNLGATIIVAAGNSNQNASNSSPANCQGVVTVAATNRAGGRAFYSNYGNVVDVAAPGGGNGGSILSTLNTGSRGPGSDSYAGYQGTSMATPHVAGVAALLYSIKPSITPSEVENILKTTARGFPGSCSGCGTGIVDAAAAVAALGGGSNPTPTATPTPAPTPTSTPNPGGSELQNGVARTGLSGGRNQDLRFTITLPQGATDLRVALAGNSGDADLYVRAGAAPSTSSYDCRPYRSGSNETCDFASPTAGVYHIMVRGYSAFSGASLVASFTGGDNTDTGGSISESNLSATRGTWKHFKLEASAGAQLSAAISGGSGDADLYVRKDSQPTLSSYACRPYKNGNNESCGGTATAGTWWISIYAYRTYSGLSLEASVQ